MPPSSCGGQLLHQIKHVKSALKLQQQHNNTTIAMSLTEQARIQYGHVILPTTPPPLYLLYKPLFLPYLLYPLYSLCPLYFLLSIRQPIFNTSYFN